MGRARTAAAQAAGVVHKEAVPGSTWRNMAASRDAAGKPAADTPPGDGDKLQ